MRTQRMKVFTTLEVEVTLVMQVHPHNDRYEVDIQFGVLSEMENVTNRLSSNSIQVNYQYGNENQEQEDEHFEDAD